MKVMLVDRETGDDRGWIECMSGIISSSWPAELDEVVTLITFCGIRSIDTRPRPPREESWKTE
jgi:hypothetical protein